ncbi:ATP-binding protein [Cohnella cholangitidis]|uniref:ATP-binding protein n=1 Tax=Cohnella cholangitidis TaxID=2598458 RepID=A0A7G5C3Z6_9BACL|nr:AAA family ATPase [Cohnella cholangitidis]QMV43930.1 ATP-binding protein [Cohnella cholangitidis]
MEQVVPLRRSKTETSESPYADGLEYVREWLRWLDAGIELRMCSEEGNRSKLEDRWESARQRAELRMSLSEEANVFLPLSYLRRIFGMTEMEEKIVFVCLAVEVDRKYEAAFELLQDERGATYPRRDLIASLVGRDEEQRFQAVRALRADGLLRRFFLREPAVNRKYETTINRYCRLDERIVRFVLDSAELPASMVRYMSLLPPSAEPAPLLGHADIQDNLRQWIASRASESEISNKSALIVSLWGDEGAGKKTQMSHLGRYFNEPVLFIDMAKLPEEESDGRDALDNVFREAAIQQALPVLCGFLLKEDSETDRKIKRDRLDRLNEMSGVVFLLSEEACRPIDHRNRIDLEIEIPLLDDEQRAGAWRTLAAAYNVENSLDWDAIASRFLFNPGQIANALRTARALSEWKRDSGDHGYIRWNEIIEACYKQLNHRLGTKSKRLSPKKRWEDLVLPETQIRKLRHACNHIKYKHTVYGSWGFDRKLSYGTGVSLLFSGPPGTGKTMAAEVVAKELDMEIYKIDLSQIISKYIGETEKNLREIFDEAESSYAILFFDEADALFGKRSEVKDSHDKNANTEVAFLLQKIEEYRGISIMATNYLQNMDEAFCGESIT